MALTADVIKSNEGLKDLTDDQISEITTLSANDENVVIGNKTKEIYDGLDADLNTASGLEKQPNEKTYDFAKRAVGHFKTQAESVETLNTEITGLKSKIQGYEKQIADGSTDEALKQKLTDTESKLSLLQGQYNDLDKKHNTTIKEHATTLKLGKVNGTMDSAANSLEFKPEYPKNVQDTLLTSARTAISSMYTPDVIEEQGKEITVFRKEDGEIARNPENKLEPFTAEELLRAQLKDVLVVSKKTPGGGTRPPAGPGPDLSLVDIGTAKTQVEADKIIEKHLMAKGFTKTKGFKKAAEFQEEFSKLRESNNVSKLPIR